MSLDIDTLQLPSPSKAYPFRILSIEVAVKEITTAPYKDDQLPQWEWRITASHSARFKGKKMNSNDEEFRSMILDPSIDRNDRLNRMIQILFSSLALMNTDIFDEGPDEPPCAVIVSGLAKALANIAFHPQMDIARQDLTFPWHSPFEHVIPSELISLVDRFGQIWIPDGEIPMLLGKLYHDSFVGPDLKELLVAPRTQPFAVAFYVGDPVPSRKQVIIRTSTEDEFSFWHQKVIRDIKLAETIVSLRKSEGRVEGEEGFRPAGFHQIHELDPSIHGPDGQFLQLFAPSVVPYTPVFRTQVLDHYTRPTKFPTKAEAIKLARRGQKTIARQKSGTGNKAGPSKSPPLGTIVIDGIRKSNRVMKPRDRND